MRDTAAASATFLTSALKTELFYPKQTLSYCMCTTCVRDKRLCVCSKCDAVPVFCVCICIYEY